MHTGIFGTGRTIGAAIACALLLAACDRSEPESEQPAANTGALPAAEEAQTTRAPSDNDRESEARAVISEDMPYAEVDEDLVYGYFVAPSDMFEPLPAVIMIHEWWGLNDEVRAAADRLAAQGYIVLAIDLFGGETASEPTAARELMLAVVEDPEAANENIRRAFEFVKSIAGAPRVGALGWRFGGTWALNTAMLLPDELDATVIYYAQVTHDEERLRPVGSPILALFAGDDVSVKVDAVEAFKATLETLRKDHEIQIYAGVGQRFASESARTYDSAAADDAWNRTLDFLGRHLASEETPTDGS